MEDGRKVFGLGLGIVFRGCFRPTGPPGGVSFIALGGFQENREKKYYQLKTGWGGGHLTLVARLAKWGGSSFKGSAGTRGAGWVVL